MIRAALAAATAALSACAAGLTVPADACRAGSVPQLVGRNVGEVAFAAGLAHRVVIPGSEAGPAAPGTLLLRVDEKGWITGAACARWDGTVACPAGQAHDFPCGPFPSRNRR